MKTSIAVAALVAAAWAASTRVVVRVEEAKVRKSKAFYAPVVASVRYKDALESGPPEDGWLPVSAAGKRGWLHESAVAAKAGRVKGGTWEGSEEAAQDEVTLAGKGFNAEVEKAHRAGDAGDYDAVDAMQARRVPDKELAAFMRAGKTLPAGAR